MTIFTYAQLAKVGWADSLQALEKSSIVGQPGKFTHLPVIRFGEEANEFVAVDETWYDDPKDAMKAAKKAMKQLRAKVKEATR